MQAFFFVGGGEQLVVGKPVCVKHTVPIIAWSRGWYVYILDLLSLLQRACKVKKGAIK